MENGWLMDYDVSNGMLMISNDLDVREVVMPLLLVGEAPNATRASDDPSNALCGSAYAKYGQPLGFSLDAWRSCIDRINLFSHYPGQQGKGSAFPMVAAKVQAQALLPMLAGRIVVFLGKRVAAAFGLRLITYGTWTVLDHPGVAEISFRLMVLPHPSGINQIWNDPRQRDAAVQAFLEALDACCD